MPESQLSPFLSRELCRGKEQVVQSGHLEEQKKNATNFMVKWISFFPSLTFTRRHSLPPPPCAIHSNHDMAFQRLLGASKSEL